MVCIVVLINLCIGKSSFGNSVPIAAIDINAIGDARASPTVSGNGGRASVAQISIFSAISIGSSTSMPRYLTVLSIFECPSRSCIIYVTS